MSNSDYGTHHWREFLLAADLQRNVEDSNRLGPSEVETFIPTGCGERAVRVVVGNDNACGLKIPLGAVVTVTPAWMGPWYETLVQIDINSAGLIFQPFQMWVGGKPK